jgi:tripartite-type tricarboxylate transporter receptor subunit TctC
MRRLLVACAALTLAAPLVHAEPVEEFYRGRQINFVIGYNPGDTYDAYARLAANALPRFIPGHPTIVAQNLPGVGSLKAGDMLWRQAARDGSVIGMLGQGVALQQAFANPAVHFDVRRFTWIGRLSPVMNFTVAWHTVPVHSIDDLRTRGLIIAATSPDAITATIPRLMNRVAGTKFKIVTGYPGVSGMLLAMERGEAEGSTATAEDLLYRHADWLQEGKVLPLVVQANARHREFPAVPALVELGRNEEERQMLSLYGGAAMLGRSILAPPDIPADRAAALRAAFSAMVKDPAFTRQIREARMEFDPLPGSDLQKLVADSIDLPPAIIARAAKAAEP